DAATARQALAAVTRRIDTGFAVRVGDRCALGPGDLPEAVDTVVVASPDRLAGWRDARRGPGAGRRVVAEVRSVDEALAALAAGVDGLVARGAECGGRVGTTGAFVLSQQVRAITDLPVWVQGGIGRHTAAA